jgi:hypothetical protein
MAKKRKIYQGNEKNPYFTFYLNDLEGEENLARCSLAAQGLWACRLLPIAARSKPFGFLLIDGQPVTAEYLADKVPGKHAVDQLRALLDELREKRVYSVDAEGRPYNRRMVRDYRNYMKAQKEGLKGGSPNLRNTRIIYEGDNPPDNPTLNPNTPSISISPQSPPPENPTQPANDAATWERRVMRYFSAGFWHPAWGGEPGSDDFQGPKTLVSKHTPPSENSKNDAPINTKAGRNPYPVQETPQD